MKVFQTFDAFPDKSSPQVMTIGNFDGIHLGHQKLIRSVVEEAKKNQTNSALITFKNHPLEVLKPGTEILRICTPLHKEKLIAALGIDALFNITFTPEFSNLDPETFLRLLKKEAALSKLILGYDAKIGKGREGNRERIEPLSKEISFELEYLSPFLIDNSPVSSSAVRHAIQAGDFAKAQKLLGRPYSILSQVITGNQKGKEFGVRTANLDVGGLALPPFGIYLVKVKLRGMTLWGVANLGYAPTVRKTGNPLLEVHIFDFDKEIYGDEMEVFLLEYFRPEIAFDSVDEMLVQIRKDISLAKDRLAKMKNSL